MTTLDPPPSFSDLQADTLVIEINALEAARVLTVDEATYLRSSFLDTRIVADATAASRWMRLGDLAAGAADADGLPGRYAMGFGESLGMAWLTEVATLVAAANGAGGRLMLTDFDALMQDMEGGLGAVCAHLDLDGPAIVAGLGPSGLMARHAKLRNGDAAFDPGAWRQALTQARARHRRTYDQALTWLDAAEGVHPLLDRALAMRGAAPSAEAG